jgi:hypothetical protein
VIGRSWIRSPIAVIDGIGDGGCNASRPEFTDAFSAKRTRVGIEFVDQSDVNLGRNIGVHGKTNDVRIRGCGELKVSTPSSRQHVSLTPSRSSSTAGP